MSTPWPVLTIAGSDSSGGAGIQADLKTITVLGGYGMSAITALTAQNTMGVQGVLPVDADFLAQQIRAVCTDIPPAAVKTGMLCDEKQVEAVADAIAQYHLPHVVVDPILAATKGGFETNSPTSAAMAETLFPAAIIVTPNLPEAEAFLGRTISSPPEAEEAAAAFTARFGTAVLLKGGHGRNGCDDLLCTPEGTVHWFPGTRISNPNTHGTGCTLSSAIAVFLAMGLSLVESVRQAKLYLTGAIRAGLDLGHGRGPLYHNYPNRKDVEI